MGLSGNGAKWECGPDRDLAVGLLGAAAREQPAGLAEVQAARRLRALRTCARMHCVHALTHARRPYTHTHLRTRSPIRPRSRRPHAQRTQARTRAHRTHTERTQNASTHAHTHTHARAWAMYAERRASTTRYLGSRPSAAGELCIDIYAAAGVGGTSLVRGIGAPTPVGRGWAIERASSMRTCGMEAPAPLEVDHAFVSAVAASSWGRDASAGARRALSARCLRFVASPLFFRTAQPTAQ